MKKKNIGGGEGSGKNMKAAAHIFIYRRKYENMNR